jgi:hypothetical protein
MISENGNNSEEIPSSPLSDFHFEKSISETHFRFDLAAAHYDVYEQTSNSIWNEDQYLDECYRLHLMERDPSAYSFVLVCRQALEEIREAAERELGAIWINPYKERVLKACLRPDYHDTLPTVMIRPGIIDIASCLLGYPLRLTANEAQIVSDELARPIRARESIRFGGGLNNQAEFHVELTNVDGLSGRRILSWTGDAGISGFLVMEKDGNPMFPTPGKMAALLNVSTHIAKWWAQHGDLPNEFVQDLRRAGVQHFDMDLAN